MCDAMGLTEMFTYSVFPGTVQVENVILGKNVTLLLEKLTSDKFNLTIIHTINNTFPRSIYSKRRYSFDLIQVS